MIEEKIRVPNRTPQIYVISPTGERIGPFVSRLAAQRHGEQTWPDSYCGNREEDPTCWAVEISTFDRD